MSLANICGKMSRSAQTLSTQPVRYSRRFPFFRRPIEYGCMSSDVYSNVTFDTKSLKFLKLPPNPSEVHFDLRKNYDTYNKKEKSTSIDGLLRWLMRNQVKFKGRHEPEDRQTGINTDFVCWRGVLTKIASTPYDIKEWKIAVIKHKGTHYMCEFETEESVIEETNRSDREKEMMYWGFKFEQYLCTDNVDAEPDTTVPVDTREQFVSVVRSRLQNHSLVYGGEVDCYQLVNGKKEYVELKTSKEISLFNDFILKSHKFRKWWLQSFLIGIPTIICGFRDDNGIVHRLHTYKTESLPRMATEWEPTICINFLHEFLEFVKENVVKDDPRTPYLFRLKPREYVSVVEMAESPEYCFLPQWYYENIAPTTSKNTLNLASTERTSVAETHLQC